MAAERADGARHLLRRREADDARRSCRRRRPSSASAFEAAATRAGRAGGAPEEAAHRPVRHLRQQHAVGLDAADSRELRVPLRAVLSARPRQGRPARQVRRDRLQRRGPAGGRRAAADAAAAATPPAGADALGAAAARRGGRRCAADAAAWCDRAAAARRIHAAADSRGVRAPAGAGLAADAHADQAVRARRAARSSRSAPPRWAPRSSSGCRSRTTCSRTAAPLPREKFYVPGAVLRVAVDETNPLAHGLGKELDVFFDNDPVFKLGPDAAARASAASRGSPDAAPLRSGWAWGQQYLDKGVADHRDQRRPGPAVPDGAGSAVPIAAARQLQAVLQRPVPVGGAGDQGGSVGAIAPTGARYFHCPKASHRRERRGRRETWAWTRP